MLLAVAEEILFRGFTAGLLVRRYGFAAGNIIQAFIFLAPHMLLLLVSASIWQRPLHAMTDAFRDAGFRLAVISEPQPDPAAQALFPADFVTFSTKARFLFFVLQAC